MNDIYAQITLFKQFQAVALEIQRQKCWQQYSSLTLHSRQSLLVVGTNGFKNGKQNYFTCFVYHNSIGNQIRETGAASLSEALKTNTQLYELNLRGECTKQIIT